MIIQIKTDGYKGIPLRLKTDLIISDKRRMIASIEKYCKNMPKIKEYWLRHMKRSPVHFAEGARMFLPLLFPDQDILYADADISIEKIKLSGYEKPAFARTKGDRGGYTTALFFCPKGQHGFFEFFIKYVIKTRCYYIERYINDLKIRNRITSLRVTYQHKKRR